MGMKPRAVVHGAVVDRYLSDRKIIATLRGHPVRMGDINWDAIADGIKRLRGGTIAGE